MKKYHFTILFIVFCIHMILPCQDSHAATEVAAGSCGDNVTWSWLNIAEMELNVMTRQCLSRCIAETGTVTQRIVCMGNGAEYRGSKGQLSRFSRSSDLCASRSAFVIPFGLRFGRWLSPISFMMR